MSGIHWKVVSSVCFVKITLPGISLSLKRRVWKFSCYKWVKNVWKAQHAMVCYCIRKRVSDSIKDISHSPFRYTTRSKGNRKHRLRTLTLHRVVNLRVPSARPETGGPRTNRRDRSARELLGCYSILELRKKSVVQRLLSGVVVC